MKYTDTETLNWLLMQPRTGYVQRDAIHARMHATRYPHGSTLLPADLDPYAATRKPWKPGNSQAVDLAAKQQPEGVPKVFDMTLGGKQ